MDFGSHYCKYKNYLYSRHVITIEAGQVITAIICNFMLRKNRQNVQISWKLRTLFPSTGKGFFKAREDIRLLQTDY